jgi:hypothetical protein
MSNVKPSQSYIDKDRASELMEKWAPVLDYTSDSVKSIDDDHARLNTAILLENQEAWCLNEANIAGSGGVFGAGNSIGTSQANLPRAGDNYATGDARLPKILIPMIRRTFPELITNEIVGVQPMSGPVGLAFALRYKYADGALGKGIADSDSDGSYTSKRIDASAGEEIGYQHLDTRFTGTSAAGLSGLNNSDWEKVDEDMGIAELLSNFEFTSDIPQMEVSFEKTAVEAGTRRLGARWSVELEQDLKNMNGIDIDSELTNAMSYEIQAEIDREMLMRMVQVALNAGEGNGYSKWSPNTADARWLAERNRDLYAKIIVEANRIAIRNRRGAANFLVATPKVAAILEMLPEFQWMQVQGNVNTQPVGIARVGNLGGRFNVYRDTRTEAQYLGNAGKGTTGSNSHQTLGSAQRSNELNYVLLGYKGPEFYDTGIIYCPYIPVMVQRTIGPNDFSPRVGLLTRYGVVDNIFGAELYYHVIIVKSLGDTFTPGASSKYF